MSFDLSSYKSLFLTTAREHLATLSSLLSKENITNEDISKLHIASHSLKGQSNAMGYEDLGSVCLSLETFFKEKHQEKKMLSREDIARSQKKIMEIEKFLEAIENNKQ